MSATGSLRHDRPIGWIARPGRTGRSVATLVACTLAFVRVGCAVPVAHAAEPEARVDTLIAWSGDTPARPVGATPDSAGRARLAAELSRAVRVRVVLADTMWTATDAHVRDDGLHWRNDAARPAVSTREGVVPWSDLVAVDVRGGNYFASALGDGVIGAFGGGAAGALVGFALVGPHPQDLEGLAPFLGGAAGAVGGFVIGTLWGLGNPSPVGEWKCVHGVDTEQPRSPGPGERLRIDR